MPEHTSWFTYLMSLQGLDNLRRMFDGTPMYPTTYSNGAPLGVTLEYTALAIFVILLILLVALVVRGRIARTEAAIVPEGKLTTSSFMENFVGVFYGMLRDTLGDKDAKFFLPIFGTCAVFIFFSNALGLLPGFAPPTGNLNVTLACGLVIFVLTHYYGVKRNGFGTYMKHFIGPIPALAPLMFPLELISHCVRPLALGIRLMVNMFVDHLLLGVFMSLVPILIPVPIMLLGILVVTVQTYVFCLLATVYFKMAVEHHEEGEGEHGHDPHHGHDTEHGEALEGAREAPIAA